MHNYITNIVLSNLRSILSCFFTNILNDTEQNQLSPYSKINLYALGSVCVFACVITAQSHDASHCLVCFHTHSLSLPLCYITSLFLSFVSPVLFVKSPVSLFLF
ncbi:hypothetical protein ILYODFUR_009661 [Ilyodon furcidens]|uniref:Uncharacterized protein n=1 Tax=Ilyodon furcidens TaxID=33524 RepID=A0ABV0SWK2_9TELE